MILLERAEYSSASFQFAEQAGERQRPGEARGIEVFQEPDTSKNMTMLLCFSEAGDGSPLSQVRALMSLTSCLAYLSFLSQQEPDTLAMRDDMLTPLDVPHGLKFPELLHGSASA